MERFVLWHRVLPTAFEEEEATAAAAQWARYVTREVPAAGGELISSLAGTVVASFGLDQLRNAVNLALRLLSEAEAQPVPAGGIPIAFGIATGEIQRTREGGGREDSIGSAIDRAQLLANQAQAGEVVLDVEAREAAARTYLFGRAVSTASVALRGETIDRARPFLQQCREAVAALAPAPIPASLRHALEPIKEAAAKDVSRTFFLDAPLGSGARAGVLKLRDELRPPAFFELGAVPGGLEPLGSLRLALLAAWHSPEQLSEVLKAEHPEAADALANVARGNPPARASTLSAMKTLLRKLRGRRGLPWFYLERLSAVDPATLSILADILNDEGVGALACVRLLDKQIPADLQEITTPTRLSLPNLEANEAMLIARAILGEQTSTDIAKQVVIAGGGSLLGLTEAARTMVAAGDVVRDGDRFVWRTDTRERRQFTGPRELLEERMSALDGSSLKYLEMACAALPVSSARVIDSAAAMDGFDAKARAAARKALIADRLLGVTAKPSSEVLRRIVIQRMPPARRAEIYRFLARALREQEPHFGPVMAATTGAYDCEGGDLDTGVEALLNVGTLATKLGYANAAVRLAAVAVQYKPDEETRLKASQISQSARQKPRSLEEEAEESPTVPFYDIRQHTTKAQLIKALQTRDHGRFDQLVETAIASGADLASAHCLRVVSYVSRADTDAALVALRAARKSPTGAPGARTRIAIAAACLDLARRRPREAMIAALEAVESARRDEDVQAEAAALKMVATVCLASGMPADAQRLEEAAGRGFERVAAG